MKVPLEQQPMVITPKAPTSRPIRAARRELAAEAAEQIAEESPVANEAEWLEVVDAFASVLRVSSGLPDAKAAPPVAKAKPKSNPPAKAAPPGGPSSSGAASIPRPDTTLIPEITVEEAERRIREHGGKIYVLETPPEAYGVWVGSWIHAKTFFKRVSGESFRSVRAALAACAPDTNGHVKVRSTQDLPTAEGL